MNLNCRSCRTSIPRKRRGNHNNNTPNREEPKEEEEEDTVQDNLLPQNLKGLFVAVTRQAGRLAISCRLEVAFCIAYAAHLIK